MESSLSLIDCIFIGTTHDFSKFMNAASLGTPNQLDKVYRGKLNWYKLNRYKKGRHQRLFDEKSCCMTLRAVVYAQISKALYLRFNLNQPGLMQLVTLLYRDRGK